VTKTQWLDGAEIVDSWRIVPRVIVFVYLGLLVWLTVLFPTKYFAMPMPERTGALTAFVSVVMTTAYGALPFIVKIYMVGGRSWGPPPTCAAPTPDP
jgi:glucose dehydrogenase